MVLTTVTAPTDEPIDLAQAKAHLRVTSTDEEDIISALIVAARQRIEEETRRALITQTLELTLDYFEQTSVSTTLSATVLTSSAKRIDLPRAPLQSVSYVSYVNGDGDTVYLYDSVGSPTVTSSLIVDTKSSPGRIMPAVGVPWPTVADRINAVTIRYIAGYGNEGESVPGPLKQALLLLLGHLYEHREAATEIAAVAELPLGVQYLIAPYRVLSIV